MYHIQDTITKVILSSHKDIERAKEQYKSYKKSFHNCNLILFDSDRNIILQ